MTDRVKIPHALGLQELGEILHAAPVAVCLLELPDLKYVWANQKYCSVFKTQLSPESIIGKTVKELFGDNPSPEAMAALRTAHERYESTNFEFLKSGKAPCVEAYWSGAILPLYRRKSETGETITGVCGFLVDVTDKFRAEQEAKINLERFLEERRLREQFLDLVAHELRNPLAALSMMTQLCLRHAKDVTDPRLQKCLASVDRQAKLMERMLAEFDSPSSTNRFHCETKPIKVNAFIQGTFEQFIQGHPSHKFLLDIPPIADGLVLGDLDRLAQVMSNILLNATRYSEAGTPIQCSLSYSPPAAAECNGKVRIAVRDYGRGIAKEDLYRVFERSFRVSEAGAPSGSGLGLYVSKQVVNQMGGELWAESAGLGRGSTFIIELPLMEFQSAGT